MTAGPHIENYELSRRLHRQRSRSPAQFRGNTGRKSPDATEYNANSSNSRKTHVGNAHKSPENSAHTGRAKAILLVESL